MSYGDECLDEYDIDEAADHVMQNPRRHSDDDDFSNHDPMFPSDAITRQPGPP